MGSNDGFQIHIQKVNLSEYINHLTLFNIAGFG